MDAAIAPTRTVRVESLTGLRWFAAYGVFLHHMGNLAPLPIHEFLRLGSSGVTFFFVLSGFVLTWSATKSVGTTTFYWRRFARIWPAHMVALLLAIPVFYAITPEPSEWWVKPFGTTAAVAIGLSVVLLQGWSSNPQILFGGNPAAWTLSCEAFFYSFHPFVNRVVRVLTVRGALIFCGGVVLAAFGFRLLVVTQTGLAAQVPLPVVRSSEFLLGMGLAAALRAGWRFRVPVQAMLLATLGVFIGFWWLKQNTDVTGAIRALQTANEILTVLYAALIAAVATRDLDGGRSWLRGPVLVHLGQWSYAFYLIHATLIYAVRAQVGTFGGGWASLWVYAVMTALCIAAAWALYRYVEHPVERRMRRWEQRRRSDRPADVAR